jgi:hypothetical protein
MDCLASDPGSMASTLLASGLHISTPILPIFNPNIVGVYSGTIMAYRNTTLCKLH